MSSSDKQAEETSQSAIDTGKSAKSAKTSTTIKALALFLVLTGGFILPLVSLLVEFFTHLCAGVFVDPIPTWWHVALVATVAAVNFLGWRAMIDNNTGHRLLPIAIGLSLGISTFYAIVFAPLTPFFFIAVIFYGIGLLALAPLLSLVSGIIVATRVRELRKQHKSGPMAPGLMQGFGLAILSIVMLEGPIVATHYGIVEAQSKDAEKSRAGIRLIRTWGSEQTLLRDCYQHTRSVSDISWLLLPSSSWISIGDARRIFYRAYGRPFNSLPRPSLVNFNDGEDLGVWSNWDSEVAGDQVGGKTAGVKLAQSELRGDISADADVSNLQWTLVFTNSSWIQQEARAQIKLPPGAVVSGATLWINGQPHEAAFGERHLVRAAYQNVVSHKRDPLLVTSSGPDRVMVQCFPIPPTTALNPGKMQIRLTITAPCRLSNDKSVSLTLPRLIEKNFGLACEHKIVLDSDKPLRSDRLKLAASSSDGKDKFSAAVSDNILSAKGITIMANRSSESRSIWSEAALPDNNKYINAQFLQEPAKPPARLIVVIDGSYAVGSHAKEIVAGLSTIPANIKTNVIFASDENHIVSNQLTLDGTEPLPAVLQKLNSAPFAGGPNNDLFLANAYRLSHNVANTSILWIHGPQPMTPEKTLVPGGSSKTKVYDLEVENGPNRIFNADMNNANVEVVPRTDDLKKDMTELFQTWTHPNKQVIITPQATAPDALDQHMPSLRSQLVSLWAYNETKNLLAQGNTDGAVKLASRYRLVTPVTGAVVLETKEDYKANGIDPSNPNNNSMVNAPTFTMSSAPEPGENLLLAIALLFISWQAWKTRLQRNPALR